MPAPPPSQNQMAVQAIRELEDCAITINDGMNGSKLKMNTSKTEFIIFGNRKQLDKCSTNVFNINGVETDSHYCITYLGAFLDETLNFKEDVRRKCRRDIS